MFHISRFAKLLLTVVGFNSLGIVLPSSSVAETCFGAEDIQNAAIASTAEAQHWGSSFSFSRCINRIQSERCWFYITRTASGVGSFSFFKSFVDNIKMSDNFHQSHSVIRGAIQNAKCVDMAKVDLDQNDGVWFYIDFDHPDKDITAVTIVMPSYIMDDQVHETMKFHGPAKKQ